ncbi:MAG: ABC-2 family transporter protein [Spirochaetales bacterium]|nr:ABC-2 family transporter protein [Spirochaetales bacterium]
MKGTIRRYLRLTGMLMKMKISRDMVYSLNFWIAFVVDLLLFLFLLLSFTFVYRYTDSINGWTLPQIIVFMGTFTIVDGLGMGTWFFGIISLPEKIRTGALDMRITKPVDTQFLVSAESFNPGSFLGPVAGAFIVRYGMKAGNFALTPEKLAGYLLLVLMMYLLMYSLSLLVMTCAFFFVKIDALIQAEESAVEFAFRIPGTAFRGAAKFVFMVLIPYGLIATVPTQFLTAGLNWGQGAAVTAITLFFVTATRLFFRFGLSRYSSAGG